MEVDMVVKKATAVRNVIKTDASGALKNLDILEERVAEIRAALKKGEPLSMGKTNLLSSILSGVGQSMGSW
jgi:hypothetical protein